MCDEAVGAGVWWVLISWGRKSGRGADVVNWVE